MRAKMVSNKEGRHEEGKDGRKKRKRPRTKERKTGRG